MKRTYLLEPSTDPPRDDPEESYAAEEFIGLEGSGEFPEWRSSEQGEDELSIRQPTVA